MNAKDYEAEWKWMNSSPEAKQRSDAAKAQAFSEFRKHFSRADVSKFIVRVDFDSNRKATGRVLFSLVRCLSISRVAVLFPPECHIQVPKPNSVMKAEIPVKATLRLLSVTTMARKNSSSILPKSCKRLYRYRPCAH